MHTKNGQQKGYKVYIEFLEGPLKGCVEQLVVEAILSEDLERD